MPRVRLHRLVFALAILSAALGAISHLHATEASTDRVVVAADRLPDADSSAPFSVDVLDAEALRRAPELRLDDILRAQIPGFSLFRRNSSRTANPTTQGVTLRNFGPSGAGRTLVLLDGIPLNDPFAGYVLWSQVPPGSVESVLVVPGGGAGLFGNAALAGTIFLVSKPMNATAATAEATVGNEETYELSLAGTTARGPVAIGAFAERFSTGGYPVIAASQRGGVDRNADAESDVIEIRADGQLGRNSALRFTGRWFDDERGNGTAYTRNDTIGEDVSVTFTQKFPDESAELQLSAYGQHRKFSSTFSSIDASRDLETPALDQFNVPADAAGGSAVWSMTAGAHRLTIGGDAHAVEGATNEAYFWNGTGFARLRRAGGDQLFAGLFGEDVCSITPAATVVAGLRFDHWELFEGFRRETDIATQNVITDSAYPDRDGNEVNGRIGASAQATRAVTIRAAFYSGFRVPTLNEFYRPFRVGNDVTEANAALKPEHLLGGEAGVDWQVIQPLRLSGTAFLNRMEDAVGNVTIGTGPGTFNPGGFIPSGGVLRQRQNVDLVVAPGFEAACDWQIIAPVHFNASYLFTHPTIERAADPALRGKLLAQTPEHVVTAAINWTPAAKWLCTAQLRYSDRQFEDDQNSRVLAPFTAFDAGVTYDFSAHLSAALRVENLFNTQVETGKSATDVVSIGAPRLVSLRVRWQL